MDATYTNPSKHTQGLLYITPHLLSTFHDNVIMRWLPYDHTRLHHNALAYMDIVLNTPGLSVRLA